MTSRFTSFPKFAALFVAAVAASLAPQSSAQLLGYDGFGNGPLNNLAGSTGGSGWTSAWFNAGSNKTKVDGLGLQYAGLATTPGAAITPVGGGVYPNSVYQRVFAAAPEGTNTIYASFLMRDDAAFGIWGGVSFGQYPYKMTIGSPLGVYTYGMLLSEGLGDLTNKPLIQGQTTFVVVKISKNLPGSGITYSMYLDPAVGSAEPAFPAASYSVGPVQALPTSISIDNGTGFTTDEIRVGTSWNSVLPAQTLTWSDLGFAKPGTSGAPHLVGGGPLLANTLTSLTLTNARPSSVAWLGIGSEVINLPFLGGTLVPDATMVLPLTTNAAGSLSLQTVWPVGVPAGESFVFQYWIADPVATFGYSASNGLQGFSQ